MVGAGAFWSGCDGADGLGFDVDLRTQVYRADFGTATGFLPDLACGPGGVPACDSVAVGDVSTAAVGTPASVSLATGCDTASGRCYADATARIAESVDVLLDDGFVGKLQGRLVTFVRVLDLAYAVPVNSVNVDIPHADLHVGPAGSTRETDPGVVFVGRTKPLTAGTMLSQQHLPIEDGSPAHATIEGAVRDRRAFVFVLVMSPRILAGSPIPSGAVEVHLTPKLTIGL